VCEIRYWIAIVHIHIHIHTYIYICICISIVTSLTKQPGNVPFNCCLTTKFILFLVTQLQERLPRERPIYIWPVPLISLPVPLDISTLMCGVVPPNPTLTRWTEKEAKYSQNSCIYSAHQKSHQGPISGFSWWSSGAAGYVLVGCIYSVHLPFCWVGAD